MDKRIELDFIFKDKPYTANVLIRDNEDEGCIYIVNLFDKQLNRDFSYSYTFTAKDNKFFLEKPLMDKEQLELIDAIKHALKNHSENTYRFID